MYLPIPQWRCVHLKHMSENRQKALFLLARVWTLASVWHALMPWSASFSDY